CRITSLGVRALAASPHLGALRELSLERNPLNGEAIAALLEAPFLPRLTHLDLSFTKADAEALRRLARSPALEGIAPLRLVGYECAASRPELGELQERFGPRLSLG